jgi:hypothetical protein
MIPLESGSISQPSPWTRFAYRLKWVIITPLGKPVAPPVNESSQRSFIGSISTDADFPRFSSTSFLNSETPAGRELLFSPSAPKSGTTIIFSIAVFDFRAMTRCKSASQQITAREPDCASSWRRPSSVLIVLVGTVAPPDLMMPQSPMTNSMQLGRKRHTRSLRRMPMLVSTKARASACTRSSL